MPEQNFDAVAAINGGSANEALRNALVGQSYTARIERLDSGLAARCLAYRIAASYFGDSKRLFTVDQM